MLTHIIDLIRQWRFWKQKRRRERAQRRSTSYEYLPTAAQLVAAYNDNNNTGHVHSDNAGTSAGSPEQRLDAAQYLDLANAQESFGLVEEELQQMQKTVAVLLNKLRHQPDDIATCTEDECVGCVTGRASMQTFPCGHRVLCRKCFIRTIQVAVSDRNLPLRCVLCRARIVRLKCQSAGLATKTSNRSACTLGCSTPPPPGLGRAANNTHPQSGILQPAYL